MMEKFLRLLNPKTTNFDSIGGGSYGALTAQDVLLAMSYANLSPLQDNLIRLKYLGANTECNVRVFSKVLLARYQKRFNELNLNNENCKCIVLVALTEFCLVAASYKASERNRAVICGKSQTFVHNHLNHHINYVVEDLSEELKTGEDEIYFQINKIK